MEARRIAPSGLVFRARLRATEHEYAPTLGQMAVEPPISSTWSVWTKLRATVVLNNGANVRPDGYANPRLPDSLLPVLPPSLASAYLNVFVSLSKRNYQTSRLTALCTDSTSQFTIAITSIRLLRLLISNRPYCRLISLTSATSPHHILPPPIHCSVPAFFYLPHGIAWQKSPLVWRLDSGRKNKILGAHSGVRLCSPSIDMFFFPQRITPRTSRAGHWSSFSDRYCILATTSLGGDLQQQWTAGAKRERHFVQQLWGTTLQRRFFLCQEPGARETGFGLSVILSGCLYCRFSVLT